jgi:hypothetical protein
MALMALVNVSACVTTSAAHVARRPPDGRYRHAVELWSERTGLQQFQGVMQLEGDALSLVILSAFDTTLARITDRVSQDAPKIELYAPELEAQRDRIERAYLALKPALVDQATEEVALFGATARVTHAEDPAGVPRTTTIENDAFRMTIGVTRL